VLRGRAPFSRLVIAASLRRCNGEMKALIDNTAASAGLLAIYDGTCKTCGVG
jgi:hypothetical protein